MQTEPGEKTKYRNIRSFLTAFEQILRILRTSLKLFYETTLSFFFQFPNCLHHRVIYRLIIKNNLNKMEIIYVFKIFTWLFHIFNQKCILMSNNYLQIQNQFRFAL